MSNTDTPTTLIRSGGAGRAGWEALGTGHQNLQPYRTELHTSIGDAPAHVLVGSYPTTQHLMVGGIPRRKGVGGQWGGGEVVEVGAVGGSVEDDSDLTNPPTWRSHTRARGLQRTTCFSGGPPDARLEWKATCSF